MTPARAPWVVAGLVTIVAVAFALTQRLPLPFDGFAALAAAVLATFATFGLTLFLPPSWVWTDDERLRHAFVARHQVSDDRADSALEAITLAHRRASVMRAAAAGFIPDLRAQTEAAADLLDGAAREIFYDPKTLPTHRANLIRAELVEEAVRTHAKLRDRGDKTGIDAQVKLSRDSLASALSSLEGAFAQAEARIANRLLTQVDTASATAETLLAPRRRTTDQN